MYCSAEIPFFIILSEERIFLREAEVSLIRSVREKLLVLPEDTRVYPGHMEETTISHEKKYNPFI